MKLWLSGEKVRVRDKSGMWDEQTHTIYTR